MIKQLDLAWAAGFFDGEGCAYTRKNGYPCISVTQKERVKVDVFMEIFGCGRIYSYERKTPAGADTHGHQWQVYGEKARFVLASILPYLREKHGRAREVLETPRTRRKYVIGKSYVHDESYIVKNGEPF